MRGKVSIFFLVLAFVGTSASAKTYGFLTASGLTDSAGDPVSARATFDVTAGSMVVTLYNLQNNIQDVGQNVSALFFTVNNSGAILSLSPADLAGSAGTQVTIGAGGTVSGVQTVTPVTHWTAGSSGGLSYLNDLAGSGSPIHTIIGPASSGGNYTTVNKSIAGNGPHDPFIQTQATFIIKDPGLLATSTVSNVTIGFGTAATPPLSFGNTVPEPGSLILVSVGMLAGALNRKFRRPVSDSRR